LWLRNQLGNARKLANHDPGRLVLVALVPPDTLFYPPAILTLVIEQHATSAAHVILQFDGARLLAHFTYLDFAAVSLVPEKIGGLEIGVMEIGVRPQFFVVTDCSDYSYT